MFQPHRYTRTRDLLAEFGTALSAADEVVLTDIYAAGEPPIAGVTIDSARRRGPRRAATVRSTSCRQLADICRRRSPSIARPGDLVITLGAGSIGGVGDRILAALAGDDS